MRNIKHQKGAVILTVSFALLFLLGFMAIALDFGHLFVVKTELQTAVDSCALAAAQELDGASDALTRATSAGKTAGNLNKVNFQGAAAGIGDADITFHATLSDAISNTPAPFGTAKYAKCTRTQSGMAPWLLQALGAFSGNTAYGDNQSVSALAVATLASAQTTCALPITLCKKSPTSPSTPYGFTKGEWLQGALQKPTGCGTDCSQFSGDFRWVDFSGGGASGLGQLMAGEGQCELPDINSQVRIKKGKTAGTDLDGYNTRFGVFRGAYKAGAYAVPPSGIPDLTGFAWYANPPLMPKQSNIYANFIAKQNANERYYDSQTGPAPAPPPNKTNQNLESGNPTIYSGGAGGDLATKGKKNRRVIVAPVADCTVLENAPTNYHTVLGLACLLLLNPVDNGSNPTRMWLEYEGSANDFGSPCTTTGYAGGSGGPLVPVLVQ